MAADRGAGAPVSGHTGRLLVATPLIGDPHFERTVVLLLAHSPAGAYGVVLNRPTDVPVAEVAPGAGPVTLLEAVTGALGDAAVVVVVVGEAVVNAGGREPDEVLQ